MFGNANREMTDKRLQTNMIESLKAAFKTIIITQCSTPGTTKGRQVHIKHLTLTPLIWAEYKTDYKS